jgi:hypothetical protein
MTSKDFKLIAATIADLNLVDAHGMHPLDLREMIAKRFADQLGTTNNRFDRGRFLKACQLIGEAK